MILFGRHVDYDDLMVLVLIMLFSAPYVLGFYNAYKLYSIERDLSYKRDKDRYGE